MSGQPIFYRVRVRNAANTADAFVVTSVRGDAAPYLSSTPSGDGQEFDPATGQYRAGAFTGTIIDAITSGTSRVVTSQLEDASFRQQLLSRRTFVEWSYDGTTWAGGTSGGVLIAGFLTQLQLTSTIEYTYTVSDPTRTQRDYLAFAPRVVIDGVTGQPRQQTIAEFLSDWPNRGCIFGGPVRGGFLNQPDLGGWEMTIFGQSFGQALLSFARGYAPPIFAPSTNAEDCMGAANRRTDDRFQFSWMQTTDQAVTLADALLGSFRDVVVEVLNPSTGAAYGRYQAMSGIGTFPISEFTDNGKTNGGNATLQKHLCKDIRHKGVYIGCKTSLAASGLPTTFGARVRVRAFTVNPSDASPIYWTGHPVDLLAKLWGLAGLDYSASSLDTVRHTLGDDKRLSLRITEGQNLGTFLESAVYGPFGIGVRVNTSGQLEAFAARDFDPAAVPSLAITANDVQTPESGAQVSPFYIDETTAIKALIFEHELLVTAQTAYDGDATDGFITQSERFEWDNPDAGVATNARVIDYSVPGLVHTAAGTQSILGGYSKAAAQTLFDRYGRGLVEGDIAGLRGGATDGATLGQEILNQLPQLPNHNKRLGDDGSVSARRMQIVRLTPTPAGPMIKLADSGPNTQPYATQPTLTIAASANAPQTIAVVTVTNAATLNGVPAGVRIQMATGASPAATAFHDVDVYVNGTIPTTAIPLPILAAGTIVSVRARTEVPGSQPSSWSVPVSVTLTAIPPVTGLAVTPTPGDGSTALAAWTPGDGTSVLDVYLRLTADPSSAAARVQMLAANSARYLLEGLTPGTSYTVGVQARGADSADVSTMVEVAFTTSVTIATLDPPSDPNGFSGSQDPRYGFPQQDGDYGLAVAATEFPGFTEFQEAIETAPYSGVYGAPTTVAKVANVQGDWTLFELVAPNDGLTRQLTARHVRDGATASAYTDPVIVAPWTAKRLGLFATVVQAEELTGFTFTESSDNTQRTYSWVRGALVESVHVYAQALPVPIATDPFNFGGALPVATLRAGTDSYTVTKPLSGTQLFLQFEPRMPDLTAGSVRRAVVDPASIITPTATMRAVKSADGSTEDLYITPKSPAQEQLAVLYRDGDTSTAPLYQLCIGASDSRLRFVNSGVEIGPADWFLPLAGGSPVQVLAAIVVRDLQVKRVTVGVQGKDTLAEAWIPWDMVMANVATGSIAISFDPVSGNTAAQAYYGFTADLPANAQSARWSVNVTAAASNAGVPNYPVDATVAASGTLDTTGRTFSITVRGPINLGDMVSITVIPFTGTSGGGTQLPSLHRYATFASFVTAKSVRMGPTEFAYSSGPAIQQQLGYLNPATTGLLVAYAQLKGVPKGVPITTFSARLYRETGVGTAELQVYKIDPSGVPSGPIGGVLIHSTTGWQTVSASVTETTDGSVYYLFVSLEQGAEPSNTSVRCAYAEADYTSTDVSKPGAG